MIQYFCFSVPNKDTDDCEDLPKLIETLKKLKKQLKMQKALGNTFEMKQTKSNIKNCENVITIKQFERKLFEKAKLNNMLVVYDRSTNKFYKDGKVFDVNGKVIFPRAWINNYVDLINALSMAKAKCIMDKKDIDNTLAWPKFISPDHRPVYYTTFKEFKDNCEFYKSKIKNLFLKTAHKGYQHYFLKSDYHSIEISSNNFVTSDEEFYNPKKEITSESDDKKIKMFASRTPIFDIKDSDNVVLSEEYLNTYGNNRKVNEYRAFVVNHKLFDISKSYQDSTQIVPQEILDFVNSKIAEGKNIPDFPKSYVLDVGKMKLANSGREVIDVVEYNPLACAGLEFDHDLVEKVILQKEISKNM